MSGGRKVSGQQITKISPSLLAVVQNVLSYAWRVLLNEVAGGSFSVCNAHEDVITERLYMILDQIYTDQPELIDGFVLFETPVREGNVRNYRGNRLDCQPDLTFRPIRGQVVSRSSVMSAIFVECKPIDSRHPVGSAYCKEGVSRFVKGDYGWSVDRAIMLAYVRNICELPEGLNYVMDQEEEANNYQLVQKPTPVGNTREGDIIYSTVHSRASLAAGNASTIILHHLWLSPEEPCETSKCRT
jgi:hypothetical protein